MKLNVMKMMMGSTLNESNNMTDAGSHHLSMREYSSELTPMTSSSSSSCPPHLDPSDPSNPIVLLNSSARSDPYAPKKTMTPQPLAPTATAPTSTSDVTRPYVDDNHRLRYEDVDDETHSINSEDNDHQGQFHSILHL